MVVCESLHHITMRSETILNEWWCVSLHHVTMRSVRLYSMNGGVSVHHITMRNVNYISMNACVAFCVCWLSGRRSRCNGCMNVAWDLRWGGAQKTWVELRWTSFSARMRWKQLRRTYLDDMWKGMGWDERSWDEVTWGEKKSDDSRWDEMRWSV